MTNRDRMLRGIGHFMAAALCLTAWAKAVDCVTLKRDGKTLTVEGRLVVESRMAGCCYWPGCFGPFRPRNKVTTRMTTGRSDRIPPTNWRNICCRNCRRGFGRIARHTIWFFTTPRRPTHSGAAGCSSGCMRRSRISGRDKDSSCGRRNFRWWPSSSPEPGIVREVHEGGTRRRGRHGCRIFWIDHEPDDDVRHSGRRGVGLRRGCAAARRPRSIRFCRSRRRNKPSRP